MRDGLGRPQTVLLLGGTSQIGIAVAGALLPPGPGTLMLAGRDADGLQRAAATLTRPGRRVETMHYDATAPAATTVDVISAAAAKAGDLDVIVLAVGLLTDETMLTDTVATEAALRANLLGPMLAVHAAVQRLRAQGHGTLVVLSSTAAVRTRPGLLTYGVAKAAVDRYARGLAAAAHDTGARVLVVRPGQVRTRMTAGLPEPPFTTETGLVAARVAAALRRGTRVVHTPAVLGPVMTMLRLLPAGWYRRLTEPKGRVR